MCLWFSICDNKFANFPSLFPSAIFLNKTGDLSDKYYTQITPAGWTFSIWGFIYTWQALWIVYSLVNICRKGPGGPAYDNPMFLPIPLFLLGIILAGLNMTWLITFDREYIEIACSTLIAYSLLEYASLIVSYIALDRASPTLAEQGRTREIWLTRGFVHNGLAIQATWVTVATLLNICMVMTYSADPSISPENAATVALSILTVEIALYVTSDLIFLDRYSRYTFTPYIVLVVALSGSISKNWDPDARNSIFSAVLLAFCVVFLIIKVVISVYRHLKKSRFRTAYDNTVGGSNKGQLA